MRGGFQGRPERFGSPQIGMRYRDDQWRQWHPDWDGHYYFHGGAYFFDPLFQFPAVVANTWDAIALTAGGLAIAAELNDDPTLYFSGTYGAVYPCDELSIDLVSPIPDVRLRAAYFDHPYFYRDGARYDRETVSRGGRSYYRFARR